MPRGKGALRPLLLLLAWMLMWAGLASPAIAQVAPTVTALSADRGSTLGGGTVTVTGTGFTDATDVSFGSATASFLVADDTNIIVLDLPPHSAGLVNVFVTTPLGVSAATAANEFTYIGTPTIDSISPAAGSTGGGTTVILTGTNLEGVTDVDFGSSAATFFADSDTQITATSPAGSAGAVNITARSVGGTSATGAGNQFTYVTPPLVQLTLPAAGALPSGSRGSAYGPVTFAATGGTNPHSFSVTGSLPPGLTLSPAGVLSGTPTAVGNYTFSVRPQDATTPGSGGPFTGAAVNFSIAIGSPRVTFVVQSATGGTFAFSSPEPSLNISVNASGGSGTSGALNVPTGSHPVSFTVPAGFVLASAGCSDDDSTLDKDSQSGTLSIQSAENVTCTITAADTGPTEELIGSFLAARSSLIIANQPDTGRRLERLTGRYSTSGGVSALGFAMSGQGMPLSVRFGEREASFAYSLRRSQSEASPAVSTSSPDRQESMIETVVVPTPFADNGPKTGDRASPFARIGVAPEARGDADPLASRFDIWAEGKLARFNSSAGDGRFGIVHAGADYLVSSWLLVGLGVQVDWTDLENDSGASIDGTGYLVGPYLTTQLTDTLYLDARAAWGQSSNTASPLGSYEDKLDGTRWLVSGALIGQYDIDRWRISPSARLTYFEEKTDEYVDGLGFLIPGVEIATGTFELGPRISYRVDLDNGMSFEPFVTLEGIWTFEQKNTGVSATSSPGLAEEGVRGRAEVGFALSGGVAGSLSASGFYDGLGDSENFEAWGGRLRLSKAF